MPAVSGRYLQEIVHSPTHSERYVDRSFRTNVVGFRRRHPFYLNRKISHRSFESMMMKGVSWYGYSMGTTTWQRP